LEQTNESKKEFSLQKWINLCNI